MSEPQEPLSSKGPSQGKAPAYQLFAKDWLVETASLTLEQQGAYQRLVNHQWVEGPLSNDPSQLARRLGVSLHRFKRIWRAVEQFFPADSEDPTKRANRALEMTRRKQDEYRARQAQKGRSSARARSASGSSRRSTSGEPRRQPKKRISSAPASASASATSAAPGGAAEATAAHLQGEPPICAELREYLPESYRPTLDGYLRASRSPAALAYAIRALGPGGIHERYNWAVIGRALFELAADDIPSYNTKRFEAFCRRIAEGERAPGAADSDAERMRRAREELERQAAQA